MTMSILVYSCLIRIHAICSRFDAIPFTLSTQVKWTNKDVNIPSSWDYVRLCFRFLYRICYCSFLISCLAILLLGLGRVRSYKKLVNFIWVFDSVVSASKRMNEILDTCLRQNILLLISWVRTSLISFLLLLLVQVERRLMLKNNNLQLAFIKKK